MRTRKIIWIDTIRFLAIYWIVVIHFFALYCPGLLKYWRIGFTGYFLGGLTGKSALVMFCVLIGYFATRKFSRYHDYGIYAVRRYFQFSINLLLINTFVVAVIILQQNIQKYFPAAAQYLNLCGDTFSVRVIIADSFFFGYRIVPTFWCIPSFFIGSLVCAALARITSAQKSLKYVVYAVVIIISILSGYNVWVVNCMLGGLAFHLINENICLWKKNIIKLPLLVILTVLIVILIKTCRKEHSATFIKQGIASALLLVVLSKSPLIQGILNCKWMSSMGSKSLYVFLIHAPIQIYISYIILKLLSTICAVSLALSITFVATVVVTVYGAVLFQKISEEFVMAKFFKLLGIEK